MVNGAYRGSKAMMEALDVDNYSVRVRIAQVRDADQQRRNMHVYLRRTKESHVLILANETIHYREGVLWSGVCYTLCGLYLGFSKSAKRSSTTGTCIA